MDLHHVFCLAPHLAKGGTTTDFTNSAVEKIFQILSVAAWKQQHPTAKAHLYADSSGVKWLKINGLESLYDEINTQTLDAMPLSIHHTVFWAAGKIYAYQDAIRHQKEPIFMDTDAILWEKVDSFCFSGDLVAAHWENFSVFEGFNANHLQTPNGYSFPHWANILRPALLERDYVPYRNQWDALIQGLKHEFH